MPETESQGAIASSRSTRKEQERPKVWTPPNKLETPPPPEGTHYRWVRFNAGGEGDDANVYERYRQGYRPVMQSELGENWMGDTLRKTHGEHMPEGTVRQGDLILMKIDKEIVRQRNAYYERQARLMQKAVDQELDGMETEHMPIIRESKTTVSRGPAQQRVDIDD